ncbi:MAG: 2-amino-4-hydroxy-6-hydroxymethyldihydropteridine diphosphokinase [Campylobacterales bacterium]|nr:2-amino-4-hydroxy-6-hydroxymethyldihydropteridine diphosphokinase [Campylobacterales bacterium]
MYIQRRYGDKLSLFKGLRFPYRSYKIAHHRYQAVVGIGGNLGDVKRRFEHLFFTIQKDKRVSLVESSLILKNPPFGFIEQEDFFNSILVLKTSMQPRVFLDYLMRLEKRFKRQRSFANAPRTLDLDIIFFDNRVVKSPTLTIPHPSWHERESVLIPLAKVKL